MKIREFETPEEVSKYLNARKGKFNRCPDLVQLRKPIEYRGQYYQQNVLVCAKRAGRIDTGENLFCEINSSVFPKDSCDIVKACLVV